LHTAYKRGDSSLDTVHAYYLVSSFSSRPSRLVLLGAVFALVMFSLFVRSPASAQGSGGYPGGPNWQLRSCDTAGNLLISPPIAPDGSIRLTGTMTGTTTYTYPNLTYFTPSPANLNATTPLLYNFLFDTAHPAVAAGDAYNGLGVICIPSYGGLSTAWNGVDNQGNLINGIVTTDIAGQVQTYFKWFYLNGSNQLVTPPVGSVFPGPSDHLDLLLKTSVSSLLALFYGTTGLTSGLSGKTLAVNSYGEKSTDGSAIVTGLHLVHAPYDSHGVATASLGGTVHVMLNNAAPYLVKSAFGYPTTYGTTCAQGAGYVSGTAANPTAGPLNATYINKDLPTNTTYIPLPAPPVVYGGSARFTSDELLLDATDSTTVSGTIFTWSTFGPGTYAPPTSNMSTWNVLIQPVTGLQTFACLVQAPGALPIVKTLTIEVGIRTDDVLMVGWIDGNGVPISTTGVDWPIVLDMPVGGGLPLNPLAAARIVALAQNNDYLDYASTLPLLIYSQLDKDYILDWMFKYAPNPDPSIVLKNLQTPDWTIPFASWPLPTWNNTNPIPVNTSNDFTCYAGYMDYLKYQAYLADRHHFKLLNHFQVKYRAKLANPAQFNGAPILLQDEALIGQTVNPTGIPPDLGPVLDFLSQGVPPYNIPILAAAWANHTLLDPQAGPANGLVGPVGDLNHISLCNDGSPDIPGIRAFNTLMAADEATPLFWQNIGSKITFKCGNTAPVFQLPENYPTYYQYQNGIFANSFKQATSPQGHFYANPYPFGTYPSYGLPPQWPWGLPVFPVLGPGFPTLPGGRNGVATTPGDGSSPTPPYTVP
jgi:hypothetical protein